MTPEPIDNEIVLQHLSLIERNYADGTAKGMIFPVVLVVDLRIERLKNGVVATAGIDMVEDKMREASANNTIPVAVTAVTQSTALSQLGSQDKYAVVFRDLTDKRLMIVVVVSSGLDIFGLARPNLPSAN